MIFHRTVDRLLPVVLLLFALGCSGEKPAGSGEQPSGKPRISATPNPVPGGAGWGTTTVSWDTGDGSWAQVYLVVDGQPDVLFVEGPTGAKPAPWIGEGPVYEFRVYAGKEHKTVLASVKVTRENK